MGWVGMGLSFQKSGCKEERDGVAAGGDGVVVWMGACLFPLHKQARPELGRMLPGKHPWRRRFGSQGEALSELLKYN